MLDVEPCIVTFSPSCLISLHHETPDFLTDGLYRPFSSQFSSLSLLYQANLAVMCCFHLARSNDLNFLFSSTGFMLSSPYIEGFWRSASLCKHVDYPLPNQLSNDSNAYLYDSPE